MLLDIASSPPELAVWFLLGVALLGSAAVVIGSRGAEQAPRRRKALAVGLSCAVLLAAALVASALSDHDRRRNRNYELLEYQRQERQLPQAPPPITVGGSIGR
ncbi:MAG TPA: hypothetical protein VNG33_18305 [Polyangiaceae bacterium]|nr:hypothetical protein [Polyangiaceae bacterium]